MGIINEKDYERLVKLISLDARVILDSRELRKEYEELHLLIEGFKPSCTGCSVRNKLEQWKNRYKNKSREEVKLKKRVMATPNNTFKLKKSHPRVVIPYTSNVITEKSSDDLVWFYLNQAKTEEDRKMRESFFEKLPDVKKEIQEIKEEVVKEPKKKVTKKATKKTPKTK